MSLARAKVTINPGESPDSLLRRFKQAAKKAEIIYEVRRREFFMPTALKRKAKSIHAKSKIKHKKKTDFIK